MINLALLSNPFNWFIVILMLVIASIAGTLLCTHFNKESHSE